MQTAERNTERPIVLVTGSNGYIGSRVCAELARDHRVLGLDHDPPHEPFPGDWIPCDLTDDRSVRDAFDEIGQRFGPRLASVVHLAAHYDFSGEPSPLYEELTVEGTRRLLRHLKAFAVGQFVFASSLLVMRALDPDEASGESPADVLDEDAPVEARWAYPRSKLRAEAVVEAERGTVPAVVLRIAGVYDEDGTAVPLVQQMRRIYEQRFESVLFPGNPQHGQSFVHVDDVARCVRAVVEHAGDLGSLETFLVGEPDLVGYAEIQEILGREMHGTRWPTIRIPAPLAKLGAWLEDKAPWRDSFIKPWMIDLADQHMPISAEHARKELGWTPDHSLRACLPEMARRLVLKPRGWYERNGLEPPRHLERIRARRARRVRAEQRAHV